MTAAADERDAYGRLLEPATAYQEVMLGLYDMMAQAGEGGYSLEAVARLREASFMFLDEFEGRCPGEWESDKRDGYRRFIDPAPAYHQFMLALYDTIAEAGDAGYSPEAVGRLREARLMVIDEFEARHPGRGAGRAIWC